VSTAMAPVSVVGEAENTEGMSHVETLLEALAGAFPEDEADMDAGLIDAMIERLAPIGDPNVVTLMMGPDQIFSARYEGLDGLRQGWADWLGSFERVRFEFEGVEAVGDNVLTLGRQIGTTLTGGVEVEQPSAAVWKFRDGLIGQVEFHLDRRMAHASALEPLS
jgi:ketosteroid isomerase-like protein